MKENDGRGARRKKLKRMRWLGGVCVALSLALFLLTLLSRRSSTATSSRSLKGQEHRLRRKPALSQWGENAMRFRDQMKDQQENEAEILQMALDAEIHLIDLFVVEEEMLSAPKNSYEGVYGKFCRLDWQLHKNNPSEGELCSKEN